MPGEKIQGADTAIGQLEMCGSNCRSARIDSKQQQNLIATVGT